jgi:uncharacterized membrane protein
VLIGSILQFSGNNWSIVFATIASMLALGAGLMAIARQ